MQNWNKRPSFIITLILFIGLCVGMFAPRVGDVDAKPVLQTAIDVVISEVRFRGSSGGNDDFIELYNPTTSIVNLNGWEIRRSNSSGTITNNHFVFSDDVFLQPGQYYLIANTSYNDLVSPDATYGTGITDDGGVALLHPDDSIADQVGLSSGSAFKEGTPLGSLTTNVDQGYERKIGGTNGACIDTDDNSADFFLTNPSNPQNYSSPFTTCGYTPLSLIINEVAWAGTLASSDDEWIELYNPGATSIDLSDGWRLVADDGSPDITLTGTIGASDYFLLERGSGNATNVMENQTFTGSLGDTDEILRLRAPDGTIVDTANSDGGAWPAGIISPASSMERVGTIADGNLSWSTFQGTGSTFDAGNHLINGTPGFANIMLGITPTFTPSITPSPTNTFTPTPTSTLTPSITPTPAGLRSVIINEVAWAGTASGLSDDEWIELYNPGNTPINLTGWNLKAADGTPDIILSGSIPAGGYFLLERGANLSDDTTVSDLPADQIYTGNALSNSGEELTLYDGSNEIIDTANDNGSSWPAGSSSTYGTMERNDVNADSDSAWHTNTGVKKNGKNANGGDILGTPKNSNTAGPTSTPTRTATPVRTPTPVPYVIDPRPILNEILPRPGFDWNQDGRMDVFDEFIEIKNLSPIDINLSGWILDDEENTGSSPFVLPDVTLKPGQRRVFYGLQTNILLSDGGDSVRLIHPNGKIYDAYTYSIAKAADQSICRLPDGNVFGGWYEDCIPTPNLTNTREGIVPSMPQGGYESPVCDLPDTLPADFFFAECHSYGANIWNSFYWDQNGWQGAQSISENMSKWESFVE